MSLRLSLAARYTTLPIPTVTEATSCEGGGWSTPTSIRARTSASSHYHPEILSLQARGEFVYAACGEAGLRIFDIAFIDHKGFSQRIVTAPVSPLGQRFFVRTRYATAVAAPTTIAPDPTRTHRPENKEKPVHAMYAYVYVTDKYEGLILVPGGTLLDGNPLNNFLSRELTYNPAGILYWVTGNHDHRDLRVHHVQRRPGSRLAQRSEAP